MALVAFDFDGTLSDDEMTVLLGRQCDRRGGDGVAAEMARITERAMNDEIEYAESLRQRTALLEGLSLSEMSAAFESVDLRPETPAVIRSLNDAGHHTAILTGGFERGVESALVRSRADVDAVVANRLLDDGDALTGEVEGPLVEGTKDDVLAELAADLDVPMAETIAVGDGANDLPMLAVAGRAIGFDPKEAVRPHCDEIVESMSELRARFETNGLL